MMRQFLYTGCFFKKRKLFRAVAALRTTPLEKESAFPHVTFAFAPDEVDRSLFGKQILVRVTGYGSDGRNEGVRVELSCGDPAIAETIAQIEVPHITLSVSADGAPFNTRFLTFHDVPPIDLVGTYGGLSRQKRVITYPLRSDSDS